MGRRPQLEPNVDFHARASRLWGGKEPVLVRPHQGREVIVFKRTPEAAYEPSLCAVITSPSRPLEGQVEVYDGEPPAFVHGVLTAPQGLFAVSVDPFVGGPDALANLICSLLDFHYEFPAGAGVARIGDSFF
jgi:hypothetical protein